MQFPNPNRIVERAFRWFLWMLAFLLVAPIVLRFLEQHPMLVAALAVTLVAAAVHGYQNRRASSPARSRSIGRAERTPVMPIEIEEDDQ